MRLPDAGNSSRRQILVYLRSRCHSPQYNGSKWYGNKITVQRARQRYYLHALEEEWREQEDKEKEQAQMSRRGAMDADNDIATASTAPLRIPRPGGRGTLTVYIDKQERQKKVRMGQYQNLLKDRRGLHAMSAALGRGPVRKSDVSTPALHPHPTASHRAVASVARRPTAAGGAARVCPPPRKKRSRLDEEDGELRGDSDEEYDTEEGEKRHGEEMHTEEAIARERSQHLGILQKLGIVPEQIREKAERPRGGERGHEGARRARDGGDAGGTEEEAADQRQGVISAIEEANEFEMNIGMQGFESLEMQLSRMRRDRSRA